MRRVLFYLPPPLKLEVPGQGHYMQVLVTPQQVSFGSQPRKLTNETSSAQLQRAICVPLPVSVVTEFSSAKARQSEYFKMSL